MTMNEEQTIRVLPVLPLRGLTAFPQMLIHLMLAVSCPSRPWRLR